MNRTLASTGQVLVLFVLFLLVLLGISALAIDYAGWLLTDRYLQNVADHSALAGASEFRERQSQGNCGSGLGTQKCIDARAQMWTSLNDELDLGLSPTTIGCLASVPVANPNSPAAGETTSARASSGACTSEPAVDFGYRIWVTTPPPTYAAYTSAGGRFSSNFGVTFTRVDKDVRSFLGGALGIQPQPRAGWATAGALPMGFALQTFCRNHIAPENGVCVNSAGVTIDGQGGIRLDRGDIGSNESVKVTANGGQGIQLKEGNVFLVNEVCHSSTWNCPNGPPSTGGISDGSPTFIGKNAFYMAPLPVPRFASPLDQVGDSSWDCAVATSTSLCVPYKNQGGTSTNAPGDWTCLTTGAVNRCGTPLDVSPGVTSCIGQGGGNPPLHYYAVGVNAGANLFVGDPAHTQNNGNEWRNIDDSFESSDPDTAQPTPADPPTDFVTSENLDIGGNNQVRTVAETLIVNLGQSGPRLAGPSTVRYVGFKTNGTAQSNDGYDVLLTVRLLRANGSAIAVDTPKTLTGTPTLYEFTVGAGVIQTSEFNSLRLEMRFESTNINNNAMERGGAVSWAEIQHPDPQPALPPMIPPGYYRSIVIPASSCAILDPTAEYSSLHGYQMPGIYRFGGSGNDRKVHLQNNSRLIGDGVTFVFDADWPDSGSQRGLTIDAGAALVLNTMQVPGTPPCTPSNPETATRNDSSPLSELPYSAVCAAWGIDHSVEVGVRPGQNAWAYCDPANMVNPHCVNRSDVFDGAGNLIVASDYTPSSYRGVTFYFTPDGNWGTPHASIDIANRFEMQGGVGGLAFRGVLYAPYDDVNIQGGNGFNTVGQVLAWTVKFHGGSAAIDLDFPYDPAAAAPYLLEPTIDH